MKTVQTPSKRAGKKPAKAATPIAVLVEPQSRQIEPPAPAPPNPVVTALHEQILAFVGMRSQALNDVATATANLRHAEVGLRSMQERLQQADTEVQYRLQLVAQIEGRTASPSTPNIEQHRPAQPNLYGNVPMNGVGSVPAQRDLASNAPEDIRSESAEDERRAF